MKAREIEDEHQEGGGPFIVRIHFVAEVVVPLEARTALRGALVVALGVWVGGN